ncbi:hypothetical protein BGZ65_012776 [Modicella reniformis]|uniref:F-box domain-containing protein n=1 Tax=Modicella reniformis TaxID=1440133 RepID=A0A9P6ILZ5_9FUNG|nr:hypothetical protein BGZ65_012776 [Modicella reniformis]
MSHPSFSSSSSSFPNPEAVNPSKEPLSQTKLALDCPEILHAIGQWIPTFQEERSSSSNYIFTPRRLLNCCLVSKYWREILTPLLWRLDDTQAMMDVPVQLLINYCEHVREFVMLRRRYYPKHRTRPMYTQLRQLTLGNGVCSGKEAMQLIAANHHLKRLEIVNGQFFDKVDRKRMRPPSNSNNDQDRRDTWNHDIDDDNIHSPTNPLGHLGTTLEELSLNRSQNRGMELYYLLRAVAKGNLRSLKLYQIFGNFDLKDLVFNSLTRLYLFLDKPHPGLHEIIGRSPHLECLDLEGMNDVHSLLDPFIHILRGTQSRETSNQREKLLRVGFSGPRQWSRPHLLSLGLHLRTSSFDLEEKRNYEKFLEVTRACHNHQERTDHLSSLQELSLALMIIDDQAREAIEVHKLNLEVLKIKVPWRGGYPTWKKKKQDQVLRRILQSCPRLREFEFWDQNVNGDVRETMTALIGDYGVDDNDSDGDNYTGTNNENGVSKLNQQEKKWSCPKLEFMILNFTAKFGLEMPHWYPPEMGTQEVEERRYFDGDQGDEDVGIWVMPKQKWNPKLNDCTEFLLDTHWRNFELFEDIVEDIGRPKEGEDLIKRFLRHISPSRKMKRLQLSQLVFTRSV